MRALFVAAALLAVAAPTAVASDTVRFATFNASLNRNAEGQLVGIPIGRMQGDFRFSFILPLREEMFRKVKTADGATP